MQSQTHKSIKCTTLLSKDGFDSAMKSIESYIEDIGTQKIHSAEFLGKLKTGLCKDLTVQEFYNFAAETAESMSTTHPAYGKLSARILMSQLVWNTHREFSKKVKLIQEKSKFFSEEFYNCVMNNAAEFDSIINYENDNNWTYFAILTLKRAYLITVEGITIERPQDMLLRVAIQLHGNNIEEVKETYSLLSQNIYTHGSPTIFNSGARKAQLASCFLVTPKKDSVEGLFDTVKMCALITKSGGGVAIDLHSLTAKDTPLRKTGGLSKGLIPYIQVINSSLKYIGQAGNRRSGCPALYLEPWHKDIFAFLDLRKNVGAEVFTGLWINDLFMKRVLGFQEWSLFCPSMAPGLSEVYGEEFEKLYEKYEKTTSRTVVSAQKLWKAIIEAQIETGTPYMLYKDTINKCSNQKNIGIIRSSNLCAEILQHTNPDEVAVCNLASICLPKFIEDNKFSLIKLKEVVKIVTKNLNRVIDKNTYPLKEAANSNLKHRPIGLGVQGLADVFVKLRYPYESQEARNLNRDIFETIYYSALEASIEESVLFGPYSTFKGSPLSKGIFHWEMAGAKVGSNYNWEDLRSKIIKNGVRNSLFVSPMPTAGTSQIFGNNEAFEPFTSNIYTRRTSAGEFQVINKYLMEDLINLGLWSADMKNIIIEHEGSIQNIPVIPQDIKALYKTVWEIKMRSVLDLAADRQPFIDQSQSLNLFVAEPSYSVLSSMHFYGWRNGLKTGMYYLRTRPKSSAIKFTVDKKAVNDSLDAMKLNDLPCDSCAA